MHSTLFPIDLTTADEMLATAAEAVRGGDAVQEALEALPGPAYLTDPDGRVTGYNRACIDFTGRVPVPGEDRWCVSWRLYTIAGEALPHEECPMATAIKERRPIRGITAIAERPDGSRVAFRPHPTPLFDEEGNLLGALNLFAELGDARHFDEQAERCRRLARALTDRRTVESLTLLATDYEDKARGLRRTH